MQVDLVSVFMETMSYYCPTDHQHYQQKLHPDSFGGFLHRNNVCQYQEHHQTPLVDQRMWHRWVPELMHQPRHPLSKLSPYLRFRHHVPTQLQSQHAAHGHGWPQPRGWHIAGGRYAAPGHTITNKSPPALTRCVSTVSSPFIDRQLTASFSGTVPPVNLPSSYEQVRDGANNADVHYGCTNPCSSAHAHNTALTPARHFLTLDCSLLEGHVGPDGSRRSSDICRSLVDTSQRPSEFGDAVCMYIDYLTRDNDRVVGEFAGDGAGHVETALQSMVNDELYRDMFCQPSSFPTSRFREWLQIYSVDLEITDPSGRKLTAATFPGCGCQAHQVAHSVSDAAVFPDNFPSMTTALTAQYSGACFSHPDLSAATVTMPRRGLYSERAREMCGNRGRKRGSGRQLEGIRRRGAKRKSGWAPSNGRPVPLTRRTHHETTDTKYSDDSAVVEFLASLQSDAVKRRRSHQQQLDSLPPTTTADRHGVHTRGYAIRKHRNLEPARSQSRVMEEVVSNELQLADESGSSAKCLDRHEAPPSSATPQVRDPAADDVARYAVPVTKIDNFSDPCGAVGKSSEQ